MVSQHDLLNGNVMRRFRPATSVVLCCLLLSGCVVEEATKPTGPEAPPTMTTENDDTLSPSRETVAGLFIGQGVNCPQFRTDTGEQVSLSGRTEGMTVGARYVIQGSVARQSKCMQGREIRVVSVSPE